MLAYIGGCLQLTLIFGKIMTKPFSRLSFYLSFVNEVFQFEEDQNPNEPIKTEVAAAQNQTKLINDEGDKTMNCSFNQTIPQKLVNDNSQLKRSIDMITVDLNQTQNDSVVQANNQNPKINIKRQSVFSQKNNEEDNLQIKKVLRTDIKKNSVNSASPMTIDQISPIPIYKKSLYKNQSLLSNFRQYFEADRLEKRLKIDLVKLISDFFWKSWYILTFICSKKQNTRYSNLKKLKFSKNKVAERLDIIYIVQKLQEIDKLKQIVLNKNQRKLFEYLPRPVLKNDLIFENKTQKSIKGSSKHSEWSILKQDESIQQKAIKAWIAFMDLINKDELDKNDKKVIKLLDIKVKNIFEIASKKITEQMQEQFNINSAKIKFQTNSGQTSIPISERQRQVKAPKQIVQRKSSSFYQFSIQGSNKRNSHKKLRKQFSYQIQGNNEVPIISLHNLDFSDKQCELKDDKKSVRNDQKQLSQSYQSSPSSKESSYSSSESSFSSSTSQNSDLEKQLEMFKSNLNNDQQKRSSVHSTQQNDVFRFNNIRSQLNEIPENIEKTPVYSKDFDTSGIKDFIQEEDQDTSSMPIQQKCDQLFIDLSESICKENSPISNQGRVPTKKKSLQNKNIDKFQNSKGSKTEKMNQKILSHFFNYKGRVKSFDEDVNVNDVNFFNKQLSSIYTKQSNETKKKDHTNINDCQYIEKYSPSTPRCQIPNEQLNQQTNIRTKNISIIENNLQTRPKSESKNYKKMRTPKTEKRKDQHIKESLYKSTSFTQFLNQLTPLIQNVKNQPEKNIQPSHNS